MKTLKARKPKAISATEARNKFGEIFNRIKYFNESFLVRRKGELAGVIIPVKDYETILGVKLKIAPRALAKNIDEARKEASSSFEKWLKKEGYEPKKLSEEEILRIISEV